MSSKKRFLVILLSTIILCLLLLAFFAFFRLRRTTVKKTKNIFCNQLLDQGERLDCGYLKRVTDNTVLIGRVLRLYQKKGTLLAEIYLKNDQGQSGKAVFQMGVDVEDKKALALVIHNLNDLQKWNNSQVEYQTLEAEKIYSLQNYIQPGDEIYFYLPDNCYDSCCLGNTELKNWLNGRKSDFSWKKCYPVVSQIEVVGRN